MIAISRSSSVHQSPYASPSLGTPVYDKSIVCTVGNRQPILCIPLDGVRHNAGISIHKRSSAVENNHPIRARVIEVEHVIDLAFEEERGVAVRLKLETVPEISAFSIAVPVAVREIGIAVQLRGWPDRPMSSQPILGNVPEENQH